MPWRARAAYPWDKAEEWRKRDEVRKKRRGKRQQVPRWVEALQLPEKQPVRACIAPQANPSPPCSSPD